MDKKHDENNNELAPKVGEYLKGKYPGAGVAISICPIWLGFRKIKDSNLGITLLRLGFISVTFTTFDIDGLQIMGWRYLGDMLEKLLDGPSVVIANKDTGQANRMSLFQFAEMVRRGVIPREAIPPDLLDAIREYLNDDDDDAPPDDREKTPNNVNIPEAFLDTLKGLNLDDPDDD